MHKVILVLVSILFLVSLACVVRGAALERYVANDTIVFPRLYDYKQEAVGLCDLHNKGRKIQPPRSDMDCPDSSFSFVPAELMKIYTGEDHPGCIQLQEMSYPNCYSDASGRYHPWIAKIDAMNP